MIGQLHGNIKNVVGGILDNIPANHIMRSDAKRMVGKVETAVHGFVDSGRGAGFRLRAEVNAAVDLAHQHRANVLRAGVDDAPGLSPVLRFVKFVPHGGVDDIRIGRIDLQSFRIQPASADGVRPMEAAVACDVQAVLDGNDIPDIVILRIDDDVVGVVQAGSVSFSLP